MRSAGVTPSRNRVRKMITASDEAPELADELFSAGLHDFCTHRGERRPRLLRHSGSIGRRGREAFDRDGSVEASRFHPAATKVASNVITPCEVSPSGSRRKRLLCTKISPTRQ